MAENGFVEKALGEAGEAAQTEGAAPGADPVAVAVAMDQARYDPELARQAAGYLEDQRALVRLQLRHYDEEHRLAIQAARRRRYADRIRYALATLAAVAVGGLLATLSLMAWGASRAHGLVIEAFSVPPDLARDGLTGQVVAGRFLDKLRALQISTVSERPAASFQNNWGADIKAEIPETGLTFSDLDRLLRERLGHESHVTGEVIQTPAGLALTARLGDDPPQTFTGPQAGFDALVDQAAQAVYRTSQPYRYAQYLVQHGRLTEAMAIDNDLATNGPPGERTWADAGLAQISLAQGDLASARRGVAAGSASGGEGLVQLNVMGQTVEAWSGHDETFLRLARAYDRDYAHKPLGEMSERASLEYRLISSAYLAGQTGAFVRTATDYERLAASAHYLDPPTFYYGQASWAWALDHDLGKAAADLAQAGALDAQFYGESGRNGYYALPAYQLAAARGDWPGALAELRKVDATIDEGRASQPALSLLRPALVRPLEARALARTGDLAAAAAMIATTAADCYLCVRVRGEIAAAMKDWPDAERWYGEAVRQAPHISFAYEERGRTRLARGLIEGAIDDFNAAHRLEPRFADPLKDWGDALAVQRQWDEARDKYDAALKLAPAWRELRRAREQAAGQGG